MSPAPVGALQHGSSAERTSAGPTAEVSVKISTDPRSRLRKALTAKRDPGKVKAAVSSTLPKRPIRLTKLEEGEAKPGGSEHIFNNFGVPLRVELPPIWPSKSAPMADCARTPQRRALVAHWPLASSILAPMRNAHTQQQYLSCVPADTLPAARSRLLCGGSAAAQISRRVRGRLFHHVHAQ